MRPVMITVLSITVWLLFLPCQVISVEKWGQFELEMNGPSNGNPFVDIQLSADFTDNITKFHVAGFYDGEGIYKIRFMPTTVGSWSYITWSNVASMNNTKGSFAATAPTGNNKGPVVVDRSSNKSFIYLETKEAFFHSGTTSYAWIHQQTYNQTLETLKYVADNGIFNKVRMMVFPKWYRYTYDEPVYYPYVGTPPNNWGNFDKFNIDYWHHLDYCLQSMLDIGGIIADVILFHPYDDGHWGFDCMGCPYPTYDQCHSQINTYNISNDLFYLQYVIARIASYRHVWYSMANEFDKIRCKSKGFHDSKANYSSFVFPVWDKYFETLMSQDPYGNAYKEKSVHNGNIVYNHSQTWTTHFSLQGYSNTSYSFWQTLFNVSKPVILDEEMYEGNTSTGFGRLTAAQETDRFWMGNSNGNLVGHSECMLPNSTDNNAVTTIMWWNLGNVLRGESYKKIGWFSQYMRNTNIHPLFAEMDNLCYLNRYAMDYGLNASHCDISQLYKKGVFYLLYFIDGSNGKTVTVNVGNSDLYQLSYIDYNGTNIVALQNVSGPNITVIATQLPYNVQLVNTKSNYYHYQNRNFGGKFNFV